METNRLLKVAEALDTALIERQALKEIGDYALEVIPDDGRIEIIWTVIRPVKRISCTLVLGRNYETDHRR